MLCPRHQKGKALPSRGGHLCQSRKSRWQSRDVRLRGAHDGPQRTSGNLKDSRAGGPTPGNTVFLSFQQGSLRGTMWLLPSSKVLGVKYKKISSVGKVEMFLQEGGESQTAEKAWASVSTKRSASCPQEHWAKSCVFSSLALLWKVGFKGSSWASPTKGEGAKWARVIPWEVSMTSWLTLEFKPGERGRMERVLGGKRAADFVACVYQLMCRVLGKWRKDGEWQVKSQRLGWREEDLGVIARFFSSLTLGMYNNVKDEGRAAKKIIYFVMPCSTKQSEN